MTLGMSIQTSDESYSGSEVCNAIVAAVNSVSGLDFWSITGYTEGGTSISDGGNDMYDGGNQINVGGTRLTYTDGCTEGTVGGNSFNMDIVANGISVTVFPDLTVDQVDISGNLGADGSGGKTHRSYEYNGWYAFWQQTHSTNDPSVTHVWITDSPQATHSNDNTDTNSDQDIVNGVAGYTLVYMLWGESNGVEVTEAQFHAVVEAAVDSGIFIGVYTHTLHTRIQRKHTRARARAHTQTHTHTHTHTLSLSALHAHTRARTHTSKI